MRVPVLLTNRRAVFPPLDAEVYDRLRAFWSFSPKGLWYMPQYKPTKILRGQRDETAKRIEELKRQRPVKSSRIRAMEAAVREADEQLKGMWDGKINLLKRGALSAGLFRATWKEAEQSTGVKFLWKRERKTLPLKPGLPPADAKYEHQNECVTAMLNNIERGGGIVLAATSSGKTAIAARLFSWLDCDCLFVVDQLDLLYQQQEELEAWLHEKVGVVGEGRFEPRRVTVATIQTLNHHRQHADFRKWYGRIQVMVVDELHEQLARRDFNVLEAIEPVAIFGLTATLQLGVKETRLRAYAFAGPVLYRFPIKEGVERGVLAKGYALQLLFKPEDCANMDWRDELRLQVLENELKLDSCWEMVDVLVNMMNRHVMVLVERVRHLEDVSDICNAIPHGVAYGKVDVTMRGMVKEMFEAEDLKLMLTNKVFKKGTSIKRIDAMIDMAEGKSKNDPVQKYGRGLRLHPDKSELIYIDFGTDGDGRFAKAAASRRKALRDAGIQVTVVKNVCSTGQALLALRKFIRKVAAYDRQSDPAVQHSLRFDQPDQRQTGTDS